MSTLDVMGAFIDALKNVEKKGFWTKASIGSNDFFITANEQTLTVLEDMQNMPLLSGKMAVHGPEFANNGVADEYQKLSDLCLGFGLAAEHKVVQIVELDDVRVAITTNEDVVLASKHMALIIGA